MLGHAPAHTDAAGQADMTRTTEVRAARRASLRSFTVMPIENLGTTHSAIVPTPIKSGSSQRWESRDGRPATARSSVAKTVIDGNVPVSGV